MAGVVRGDECSGFILREDEVQEEERGVPGEENYEDHELLELLEDGHFRVHSEINRQSRMLTRKQAKDVGCRTIDSYKRGGGKDLNYLPAHEEGPSRRSDLTLQWSLPKPACSCVEKRRAEAASVDFVDELHRR